MSEITVDVAKKVLTVVDAGLVRGLGIQEPGYMCVEAAVCFALDLPHGDNPACVAPVLRDFKIYLNDFLWSSPKARAKGLRRLAVAQLGSVGVLDETDFTNRLVNYAIQKSIPLALRAVALVEDKETFKTALLDAAAKCEITPGVENGNSPALEATYVAESALDASNNPLEDDCSIVKRIIVNALGAVFDARHALEAFLRDDIPNYVVISARSAAKAFELASYGGANSAVQDKLFAEYAEDVVGILIEMGAPGCQWLALTEVTD